MIKYDPNTGEGSGPPVPVRVGLGGFNFRNIVLLVAFAILLGIVAYGSYKVGESRGVEQGNADRDAFYQKRLNELSNFGASGAGVTPGITTTVSSTPALGGGQGTLARIDKIEGDKMTVLFLDKTGAPTGVTLTISLSQQPLIWKSDRTDGSALSAGQNILFVGQTAGSDGTYTVSGILVLPLSES